MVTRILVLICLIAGLVYALLNQPIIACLLVNLAIFNQLIITEAKLNELINKKE